MPRLDRPTTAQSVTLTQVRRKNSQMRRALQIGRKIREEVGDRGAHGQRQLEKHARTNRINEDTARKLRHVAGVISDEELDQICSLCEKKVRPLGVNYLVQFARVDDPQARRSFWKRVVRDKFSVRDVLKELKTRGIGRVREAYTGRRRKVDVTDEAAIRVELRRVCWTFLKFHEELEVASKTAAAGLSLLTKTLRDEIALAVTTLTNLRAKANRKPRAKK